MAEPEPEPDATVWIGIGMVWTELPLTFREAVTRAGGIASEEVPVVCGGYRIMAPETSSPGPAGDVAAEGTLSCTHGLG